jgi:hypothetical protein
MGVMQRCYLGRLAKESFANGEFVHGYLSGSVESTSSKTCHVALASSSLMT